MQIQSNSTATKANGIPATRHQQEEKQVNTMLNSNLTKTPATLFTIEDYNIRPKNSYNCFDSIIC